MKFEKKGKNLLDVQEMNRSLLIDLLRTKDIWTRSELSKKTGLKRATISNIINDFIDWGLVNETGILYGNKNRRSIGITLRSTEYGVIGIRLSRNFFSIGLFDLAGTNYNYKVDRIDILSGPDVALGKIKEEIKNLIENNKLKGKIVGIGIAVPGPYFKNEGRIALMTEFPGWGKISIKNELKSVFNVPVYFEHDANAAAIAEWWHGKYSSESETLIFIFITEGVGSGIVIDGNLYRGNLGIAGEIGHTTVNINGPRCECGNHGCLEHYCSTLALVREVKSELSNYPDSVLEKDCSIESIFSAFNSGDELANKVINKTIEYLGYGIINIINSFNPDTIIIGGEIIQGGSKLIKILKKFIKKHLLSEIYENTVIEFSTLKGDEVVLGAGIITINKILQSSSLVRKYLFM